MYLSDGPERLSSHYEGTTETFTPMSTREQRLLLLSVTTNWTSGIGGVFTVGPASRFPGSDFYCNFHGVCKAEKHVYALLPNRC